MREYLAEFQMRNITIYDSIYTSDYGYLINHCPAVKCARVLTKRMMASCTIATV